MACWQTWEGLNSRNNLSFSLSIQRYMIHKYKIYMYIIVYLYMVQKIDFSVGPWSDFDRSQ